MEEELYHYAILGMKWDIRKNPVKAYHKATTKKSKLDTSATKKNDC